MLERDNFTIEHIRTLQQQTKRDPALLERVLFAFGLVEALTRAGTPFIFKGGTSLLLLMDSPRRISTDIDIVVDPKIDIDSYINRAATSFPFTYKEEQHRVGQNGIVKRHFKFFYDSPLRSNELYILLDILYEDSVYNSITVKPIVNDLLLTKKPISEVRIPTLECMAGDKLTAFAPHITGIPFGVGKELEIIKQFFDIAMLADSINNLADVRSTYQRAFVAEAGYRGLNADWHDGLTDTIRACVCIMGKGKYDPDEFSLFAKGIDAIKGHIFSGRYSGEIAAVQACKVMYLAACLFVEAPKFRTIPSIEDYQDIAITDNRFVKLSYIRKLDLEAYAYLIEAIKLIKGINVSL